MNKKLIGSDYLLLLLYLNNAESIRGAIRLTKMMFLFEKQIAPALKAKGLDSYKLPDFISYNYGPFSRELYQQLELFKNIGFIDIEDINSDEELADVDNYIENEFDEECFEVENEIKNENKFLNYTITNLGASYVEKEILPVINDEQRMLLQRFKQKVVEMSTKQLLYYVYTKYPDFTDKSLIKDEVLKNGN